MRIGDGGQNDTRRSGYGRKVLVAGDLSETHDGKAYRAHISAPVGLRGA